MKNILFICFTALVLFLSISTAEAYVHVSYQGEVKSLQEDERLAALVEEFVKLNPEFKDYDFIWISPKPGKGSVQVAEKMKMLPTEFIKINLALRRYVYPGNVALIYTWQKFAIPVPKAKSSHKKVESILLESKKDKGKEISKVAEVKKTEKLDKARKTEGVQEQAVKNDPDLEKEISNAMSIISADQRQAKKEVAYKKNFSVKHYLFLIAVFGVLCLIILWLRRRFSEKKVQQFHQTAIGQTFEKKKQEEEVEIEELIPVVSKQMYHNLPIELEKLKLGDEGKEESFFIAFSKVTGHFEVVHGESCYISPCKGTQGLEEAFKFLIETYNCEVLRKISFKVPSHLTDQYASVSKIISRKRRIFELCDQRNQFAAYEKRNLP